MSARERVWQWLAAPVKVAQAFRVVSAAGVAGFAAAAVVCLIAGNWPEGFLFASMGALMAALFVSQTRFVNDHKTGRPR